MEYLFFVGLFMVFFVWFYFAQREVARRSFGYLGRYINQCVQILEDIFRPLSEKTVKRIVWGFVVVFGTVGFFLPGKIVDFNLLSLNRAISMNQYGKFTEAFEILIEYREVMSPVVYNELGVSKLGIGSVSEAIGYFKKALNLKSDYAQAHANLAYAYALSGQEVDARFEMRRARSIVKMTSAPEMLYGLQKSTFSNLPSRILLMLLFSAIGWYLPRRVLKFLQARRIRQFSELLPDGLVMATNGLRAGLSLGQVFEVISREAPRPLNQEFGLVVKQQQFGKGFNESLEVLKMRMPTDDVAIFVNSTCILREVGGNLTEVFESLAYTIRERKMIKQKIATMTAEGKSQAIILTILPFVLGYILDKLNPEVFSLMYTTPLGWLISLFMLVWGSIGCFLMWKTVQVKI